MPACGGSPTISTCARRRSTRSRTTIADLRAEQRLWSAHHTDSALFYDDADARLIVTGAGVGASRRARSSWTRLRRRCCAAARTIASHTDILAAVRDAEAAVVAEAAVAEAAERLVALGFVLREGREYLSLPLCQPGWQRAPTWGEMRQAQAVQQAARRAERNRATQVLRAEPACL